MSLRDTGGKRVLLVKVSLLRENDDDHKFPEVVDARAEALKAVVLNSIQELTLEEANNPSTRTRMALELHGKLSDILGNAHPFKKNGVIISEWITQEPLSASSPAPPTLAPSGGDGIVAGVRYLLLMIAVVMGQSVFAADKKPLTKKESPRPFFT